MKRLILAGLLSTACAQAFAQPNGHPLQSSRETPLAAGVALPDAPQARAGCPPAGEIPGTDQTNLASAAYQARLQQHLAQLDKVSELCLDNARFHAQRGLVLQLMGQPAGAVESLERSLLIDPDQPGTQLDYALALRDAGDAASAQALLQQISQRTDVPPGLQPVLQGQLATLQADLSAALRSPPKDAWEQYLKVSSAAGFDSNLNNATSNGQLTLTFPGGDVALPLADASRAQRGGSIMTALQYQAVKPSDAHIWVLQAELRNRTTRQADTGYQQLDLAAQWLQAPADASQWQAKLGYSQLRFGGIDLLHSLRTALVHQWQPVWPGPGATCRPLAGLEADIRRYPTTRQLDGTYSGLLLSLACDTAQGRAAAPATGQASDFLFGNPYVSLPRFNLQLRKGQDRASNSERPGGNYAVTDVRAAAYGRLQLPRAPGLEWTAEYSWLQQRDSAGYSPLLGNNAPRKSIRQAIRLELAYQLPASVLAGAQWFASAEISRQASNISAFSTSGRSFYSGLRWDIF